MASTLPPDPYAALGVSKNADAATIKSTYRKLVLKCHPDKITGDEALKAQKQDEFVKIQQAYDVIGDEEKRAVYDAEVRLEHLRKEKQARGGNTPHVEVRTAGYGVRTQAPAGAAAAFDARGPSRYDVPKSSSRAYDDDRYRGYEERHREYATYESVPSKHTSSSRTSHKEREPVRAFTRSTTDRTRSDHKKSRDKEERRERSGKYAPYVSMEDESSSGDDKGRFESAYRRRTEEEEAQRVAADARRRAEETRRGSYEDVRRHRSSDDDVDRRKQKTVHQAASAADYIQRAKGEADVRPSPTRTTSYYPSRRTSERPEAVRRSSARPKDHASSSGRDRDRDRMPDIVDWAEDDRKPSLSKSTSSPADIHVPSRSVPVRSYTTSDSTRRTETSPTPSFRRTETAPVSTSSRRKEGRPSGLRNAENADSGYSSSSPPLSSYPSVPPPQSSTTRKVYHYPSASGGVRLTPEDLGEANGYRTVHREPATSAPLSRPPMGANRPSATSTSQRTASVNIPPPPLGRAATFNHDPTRASEDRGRSRTFFGENGRDTIRRGENLRQPTSYSPDRINFAKRFTPEDVSYSRHGSERERDFVRPTLSRNATYAVA